MLNLFQHLRNYPGMKFRKRLVDLSGFGMTFVIFLIFVSISFAQSKRELINEGVDYYNQKKFTDAEVNFKKGIEKASDSFEANFNLGDAYFKQKRYDESLKSFQSSLELAQDSILKAKTYHNIGNSLLKSEKIKESIEAYKNALKINPNDRETKYNLSYALSLLEKQQNQKQQNKQNQNQQNKDQQDKQEQNKDQQKDQKQENQNQQPQQNKISKEEAERILEALKNNEKDLQKQLRKKKGVPIKTEKDW
jgi:tetratricopeptide (TPR) repeat protein